MLNNRISEYLMMRLAEIGVPTHFVRRLNMREQLIREVEIIPLKIVVRNVAAGSLSTRLGIPEGTRLPRSIIEYYYKNDALNDPMVAEEHITAFGWAATQDMDDIVALVVAGERLPDRPVPGRRHHAGGLQAGVRPAVGGGRHAHRPRRRDQPGQLPAVGQQDVEKMDKDRFRRDLGRVEEAYQEVARRLGILPEAGNNDLKGPETVVRLQ